jgi:hypothetical protein
MLQQYGTLFGLFIGILFQMKCKCLMSNHARLFLSVSLSVCLSATQYRQKKPLPCLHEIRYTKFHKLPYRKQDFHETPLLKSHFSRRKSILTQLIYLRVLIDLLDVPRRNSTLNFLGYSRVSLNPYLTLWQKWNIANFSLLFFRFTCNSMRWLPWKYIITSRYVEQIYHYFVLSNINQ